MTYFKKKTFTSQKGNFPNFKTQKPKKKKNRNATKQIPFLEQLRYFLPI